MVLLLSVMKFELLSKNKTKCQKQKSLFATMNLTDFQHLKFSEKLKIQKTHPHAFDVT